jgi:endonuclease YncB( thermonuclease family)
MEQTHFNTKEAVEYLQTLGLNFKPSTLEVWRSRGRGPRYKKVARKVYYEKSDLNEFIKGNKIETIDSLS